MNSIRIALFAAALCTAPVLAADDVAPVASVEGIEGTTLVNTGSEYVTATDAQALAAGDQLMVMEGSAASIRFADGCVLPIEPGSLVTVPAQSTCAGGVAAVQKVGPMYAQAVGDAPSRRGTDRALTVATSIGLTFAAMIAAENSGNPGNDDDEPVSP